MRAGFVMAVAMALATLVLTGCAGYGVHDWGDQPASESAAIRIGSGERKLVHTPPGDSKTSWSVLLLLDAPRGAWIRYGKTDMQSDLIETGETPNYVRVKSPGGTGVFVENPPNRREISATFVFEWK